MFTPVVTGRIHVPDMFTLAADGITARVVTGGIEVIGDNFDVRICRCADLKLKQGLSICISAYIHICHLNYILSGTAIPNKFIPWLMTFAEADDNCSRNILSVSSSAWSIDLS